MTTIPEYVWLSGDEDGGVTGMCGHPSHGRPDSEPIAYYGWSSAYPDLPHFDANAVAAFVDHLRTHADIHAGDN